MPAPSSPPPRKAHDMPRTTIEQLRENFSYDPNSGELTRIKKIKGKFKVGDLVGTENQKGYLTVYVLQEKILVHRIAWAIYYGVWPEISIDHKNRNKKDNSINNLRLATDSQNSANRSSTSKYGYRGVQMLKHGRYQASIAIKGKTIYLGSFDSKIEAAKSYNNAAFKIYGEFAVLNEVT